MLILLGVLNVRGFKRAIKETVRMAGEGRSETCHTHCHHHGEYVHSHIHGHDPEVHGHKETETPTAWLDSRLGRLGIYRAIRPLIVGIVHGLAGSAAVALLVLPLIHEPLWAAAYLLIFGLGTIGGMMLITAAIALPFAFSARRSAAFHRHLGLATGMLSFGFGLFLVYQIGFVDGLFIK
jgi:high-affinity nickel-transport protein